MKSRAVELEVFRHLLASVAEEMGIVLRKTSFSANIKERRDYSCAVYDASGQTVAMGEHMPVHLGAMPMSVRFAIDEARPGPGDVAILNDPFRGGTHLPDITAVAPVFVPGKTKPSFYVANRAHHADVGGMSPGSMPMAQEIFQEGLRIPPLLLVEGGRMREDILRLILANVRTPAEREGDLRAQLVAIGRGEARLLDLVERYGTASLSRNMAKLIDYSEAMMRAAIRQVPDGEYRFEDFLDSDGITDEPVRIAVLIRIRGDSAEVDFAGSDAQRRGPVNANLAIVTAATAYVFRCLLDEDVPFTAGLLRPIRILAPERSVVNAEAPAPMAAGNVETSQRITDVLLGALALALPDRIPAASSGTMNNISFGGWDSRRGRSFAHYETIAGGMGASRSAPGHSAVHTHMTNSWNTPVEAFEYQFPVRVNSYSVRRSSGGAGGNRGGDGIVREYQFLVPATVTLLADRRARGPWGLAGGGPGLPGNNFVVHADGTRRRTEAKTEFETNPNESVRIESPGGGGWGTPD